MTCISRTYSLGNPYSQATYLLALFARDSRHEQFMNEHKYFVESFTYLLAAEGEARRGQRGRADAATRGAGAAGAVTLTAEEL